MVCLFVVSIYDGDSCGMSNIPVDICEIFQTSLWLINLNIYSVLDSLQNCLKGGIQHYPADGDSSSFLFRATQSDWGCWWIFFSVFWMTVLKSELINVLDFLFEIMNFLRLFLIDLHRPFEDIDPFLTLIHVFDQCWLAGAVVADHTDYLGGLAQQLWESFASSLQLSWEKAFLSFLHT